MSNELAEQTDQALSARFYGEVDRALQGSGPFEFARAEVFFRMSRAAIACDVDWSELHRVLSRIAEFEGWYAAWAESGRKFARLAETAADAGRETTAAEHHLRASMLFHFAQLFTRPENPDRAEGRRLRVSYFRAACPHLSPPIEQVSIPADGLELPGYLRHPLGGGSHPGLLMLPGANSVKEELHHWAAAITRRGVATLALDGPGQGELAATADGPPLRFESYTATVAHAADWLAQRSDVDADRVGVWGQSTGGQLAIRLAAEMPSLAAVVSVGGAYDFRCELSELTPADVREEARDLHDFGSFEEAARYVSEHGSLDGQIGRVTAPLLLVHGGRDELVDDAEVDRIATEAGGPSTVLRYPDGSHGVTNFNLEMTAAMSDWVSETLALGHAPGLNDQELN